MPTPQTGCVQMHHSTRPVVRVSVCLCKQPHPTNATEQHTYLPHDTDTGSTLPNLPATMPNGRARRVTIVEGGYCSDVSYLEKVREKGQQHAKLEKALRLYGYHVTSVTYICGSTGSQYHSSNDTRRMLGIEHSVAKKLRDKCIHTL